MVRMTRIGPHLPVRVDGRVVKIERALWIHNSIRTTVANQHRALDVLRDAVEIVVGKLTPRCGQIFGTDNPAHAILNRRIVVKQIGAKIV